MTETDEAMKETTPPPARRQSRPQTWRARWFGERDEVADQLADIARQDQAWRDSRTSAPR